MFPSQPFARLEEIKNDLMDLYPNPHQSVSPVETKTECTVDVDDRISELLKEWTDLTQSKKGMSILQDTQHEGYSQLTQTEINGQCPGVIL